MNDLGEIIGFKYPAEVRSGRIIVQQDHPTSDPYIAKWSIPDPRPDTATIDAWRIELQDAKADEAVKESNRDAAKGRIKNNPPTNNIQELRSLVDDIITYLGLD